MGNTPKVRGGDRQARAAAARKAAHAKERRRRMLATVIGAVVVLVVVGVLLVVGLSKDDDNSASVRSGGSSGGGSVPTWPAPTGDAAKKAVAAAGLQAFGQEMLSYHVHAHLDVIINGKPVTVPAQLGFVYNDSGQPTGLTSLHTHAPDGIIHIEAPKKADYTLGQVFKEWQVPLSANCIGSYCADATHTVGFYVNGKKHTGDPSGIVLNPHDEIAAIYAAKGSDVKPPSSFDFPAGD